MTRSRLALAVAGVMVLVSCGGGGGGGDDDATAPVGEDEAHPPDDGGGDVSPDDDPDRQMYIDAFTESFASDESLTADEVRCFGVAIVDSVGTEKLSALTPEEVVQSAGKVPSELGVEVTEEEAEAFYDAIRPCVDIEAMFARSSPDEDPQCLIDGLDDDLLHDFYVMLYLRGTFAFVTDSDLMARIEEAASGCRLT